MPRLDMAQADLREPAKNPYQCLLDAAHRLRRLLCVDWELTAGCQGRCTRSGREQLRTCDMVATELSTAECLQLVDELETLGVLNLTWRGDELLSRADFLTLAEYAHNRRFLLRLLTAGDRITAPIADRIAELHPFVVEISVYGWNAATHDAMTGSPGSFGRTVAAIRRLRALAVRTVMRGPFRPVNAQQLAGLRALADDLEVHLRIERPALRQAAAVCRYRLSGEELEWLKRATVAPELWLSSALAKGTTCSAGQSAAVIDPYGNVFACAEVHLCVGNVRLQPLTAIWHDDARWAHLQELVRSEVPACWECTLEVQQHQAGRLAKPTQLHKTTDRPA